MARLRAAAANLALTLGTLLAVEAVWWLGWPARALEVRSGWTRELPGFSRVVRFERTAGGMRAASMTPLRPPAGTVRLLAVGASTTEQTMQSIDATWTATL